MAKDELMACGFCLDGCRATCVVDFHCKNPTGYRIKAPRFCAANHDGECHHPGCPQKQDWKPSCPIPDQPEDD